MSEAAAAPSSDPEPTPRFELLTSCEEKARQKWVKNTKQSLLSSLPPIISKDTKFSHALQERLTTQIESEIAESLKRTYADLDLKSKLAKLDEICKKAKEEREGAEGKENSGGNVEKKRAWRPSGSAADDQAAHDVTNVHHRLKSIQTDLLDDIKKENDELRSRVNELQSSIESGEKEILTAI